MHITYDFDEKEGTVWTTGTHIDDGELVLMFRRIDPLVMNIGVSKSEDHPTIKYSISRGEDGRWRIDGRHWRNEEVYRDGTKDTDLVEFRGCIP